MNLFQNHNRQLPLRSLFALCCALLLAAAGCSNAALNSGDGGVTEEEKSLAYSVYAGEDAAGAWATFAFAQDEDGKDVVYYFSDNAACYSGAYTYNAASKTGEIAAITARNQAATDQERSAPGPFTLSGDETTITFSAYPGGGERTFPRRRGREGDRSADDPPPPDLTPLTAGDSLDGTVWAATAYRTRDWTTLAVTASTAAAGTITVSHSFDCTSFPRAYGDYAYNANSTLAYIGPFRVNGTTFTFLNFYGHNAEITLKRLR
jgi:hypothetical protein